MKFSELLEITENKLNNQIEESWASGKIQSIRDLSNKLTGYRNLYHITDVGTFLNIMKVNTFLGTDFRAEPKSLQFEGYESFISTATSLKSKYMVEWLVGSSLYHVLIVFDGWKLKRDYSIIPVSYFKEIYKNSNNFIDDHLLHYIERYNDEKERRVLLKELFMDDAASYIKYVVLTSGSEVKRTIIDDDGNKIASPLQLKQEKELNEIKKAAKKRGVDLYYAPTYSDLVSNNIEKIVNT